MNIFTIAVLKVVEVMNYPVFGVSNVGKSMWMWALNNVGMKAGRVRPSLKTSAHLKNMDTVLMAGAFPSRTTTLINQVHSMDDIKKQHLLELTLCDGLIFKRANRSIRMLDLAGGDLDRLPDMAYELIQQNPTCVSYLRDAITDKPGQFLKIRNWGDTPPVLIYYLWEIATANCIIFLVSISNEGELVKQQNFINQTIWVIKKLRQDKKGMVDVPCLVYFTKDDINEYLKEGISLKQYIKDNCPGLHFNEFRTCRMGVCSAVGPEGKQSPRDPPAYKNIKPYGIMELLP
jgi:hypothetical protein